MATISYKPPITLVLGESGSGKTEHLLQRFTGSLGRSLLIMASDAQAQTYRERLAEMTGYAAADFEGSVLSFRRVVSDIATHPPFDNLNRLSEPFQRMALNDICQRALSPSDFLGRMRETPGFAGALLARIREWKLACITPDALEAATPAVAERLGSETFRRKTTELTRLYRAYEEFLEECNLCDAEDLLHLATKHIRNHALLPGSADLVLMDGFFRLNRAQVELLVAIAERKDVEKAEVVLTLPFDAKRPLLFAASERSVQTLRAEFNAQEVVLHKPSSAASTPLSLLEARLFEANVAAPPALLPSSAPPIQIFDAPNNYVEAEMVAREFKRLHATGGYRWDDFAIILRTQGEYAPILSAVFERYGVPLGVDGAEILAHNPLIKTLLSLLDIVVNGWRREDVLSFLKSSYTLPNKLEADSLRRLARAKRVREGRSKWLALAEEGERLSALETLHEIEAFEAEIKREVAPAAFFAERIAGAAERFGLLERGEKGETLRALRDAGAWKKLQEVLEALRLFSLLSGEGATSLRRFYNDLKRALQETSAAVLLSEEHVRVSEPYEARESPLRVVAVMGMKEKVFPRRITEDPFFRDEERRAMREIAGMDLEEQKGRADDERLLFYLAASAPRERLILSFPRSSNDGDALPSFYLDEARAIFTGDNSAFLKTVSRTLADVAPRPEEAVSSADRLLTACANLFDPGAESDGEECDRRQKLGAEALRQCLQEEGGRDIVRAVLLSRNEPKLPVFQQEAWTRWFAERQVAYSVSELETYQRCPFQYLLRHVWRVHAEEDGANPRTQGTLLHGVLSRYFREKRDAQEKTPDTAEALYAELKALLLEEISRQALDSTQHRIEMTQRLLLDALRGFAQRETAFAPVFLSAPAYFELAFGMKHAESDLSADEDRAGDSEEGSRPAYDPASCEEPLNLRVGAGEKPVRICGTIDRVDAGQGGRYAIAMDYKLGKPPEPREYVDAGRSLQMPLYLLALERVFGKTAGAGCYDSMSEAGRPRVFRSDVAPLNQFRPAPNDNPPLVRPLNRDQFARMLRQSEVSAIDTARSIESAKFPPTPGRHCAYCAYLDVCRTTVAGGHDGETEAL